MALFRVYGQYKSRIEGPKIVPTVVSNSPRAGVKTVLEIGNRKPIRNASTMARKATKKESVGKSMPIRKKPDPTRSAKGISRASTSRRIWNRKDQKRANLCDETQGELDEEDHFRSGGSVIR